MLYVFTVTHTKTNPIYTLLDKFNQEAFSTIIHAQTKIRTYGLLKNEIGMESYLQQITNPIIRQNYTTFRLSNHSLNIEEGK